MLRELEGEHASNYKSQILEPHFTGTAPTEESLKKYYQKLSSKLHPDKQANSLDDIKKAFEERFKDAKAAYEHLKDPQKTASFTQEAQTNPEQLRTIVEEMSSGKWDKVRAKAEKAAQDNTRLRIEGPEQQASGAFSKFMAKRSPNQKVALAFAGVATVGLGVYGAAKWMESRKETQRNKETDAENSWTHKIEKDTLAPSAAASAR